jgi:NAD(P)-dependent dehydrogenase (short-subunit alcohol dehydrogenase family)
MTHPNLPSVALVTGATRGIGVEVVRQLAEQGSTVFVSGRDPARVEQTAQRLADSGDVRPLPTALDVTDPAQVEGAIRSLRDGIGRLDILVNNAVAAIDVSQSATGAEPADVSQVLQTNLVGAWALIRAALPLLRRSSHPRIVNVSSGAGSHGDPEFGLAVAGGLAAPYAVSKAALNALTSALAAELSATPILVNAVCPGLTASDGRPPEPGVRSLQQGAASIVWAATLADDGPSGGLFRDGRPLPW